jgi:hypothetical protein
MPRTSNTNVRDEHLIFVKNVPADLAKAAIPELFAPYEPERIKNVYPRSDITTVVVGFRTHQEANRAQQDTDGLRLENVVLRVEMYSKHRSVRFLREARTNWSSGAEEDEFEEEYEDESLAEPEYTLPFGRASQERSGPATWAQVIGDDRQTGMMPLPPPGIALRSENATRTHSIRETSSKWPSRLPVPHSDLACEMDNAETTLGLADSILLRSPNAPPFNVIGHDRDDKETRKLKEQTTTIKLHRSVPTSIFASWEPINTSQRISQRHCHDCIFCQKRVRN